MHTERYRYVEWRNRKGELASRERYDHQTDPQENENLAVKPECQDLLDELAKLFRTERRGAPPSSVP